MKCLLFFPLRHRGKGDSIQLLHPLSEALFSQARFHSQSSGSCSPRSVQTLGQHSTARLCTRLIQPAAGQKELGVREEMLSASRMILGKSSCPCMLGHLSAVGEAFAPVSASPRISHQFQLEPSRPIQKNPLAVGREMDFGG